MTKLKLDLDTLHVSSFETGAEADARGTVQGRDAPPSIWDRTICICTVKPTVVDPGLGGPVAN